jgi:hypothetical protein
VPRPIDGDVKTPSVETDGRPRVATFLLSVGSAFVILGWKPVMDWRFETNQEERVRYAGKIIVGRQAKDSDNG